LLYNSEKEDLRRTMLDPKEKYSIALQIAKIMATFHQFNPPICHGHLTSHNIMLEQVTGAKRF
jgi:tRNA A-37 threonylcarbamoyl transferase component Bud32